MGTWVESGTTFTEIENSKRSRLGGGNDRRGQLDAERVWSSIHLASYIVCNYTVPLHKTLLHLVIIYLQFMLVICHVVILGRVINQTCFVQFSTLT